MSDDVGLDIFDPIEREPGPGFPVHVITVTGVEYDDPIGDYVSEPELEYTIDHGTCEYRGDDCLVESCAHEGLHAALFGVWDPSRSGNRLENRAYRVRGWTSKYDVPGEPIEYDAGITLIDDEE